MDPPAIYVDDTTAAARRILRETSIGVVDMYSAHKGCKPIGRDRHTHSIVRRGNNTSDIDTVTATKSSHRREELPPSAITIAGGQDWAIQKDDDTRKGRSDIGGGERFIENWRQMMNLKRLRDETVHTDRPTFLDDVHVGARRHADDQQRFHQNCR